MTQAEWESVIPVNPSHYRGPRRPVEQVTWTSVQRYIKQLNELTGEGYRLPTEAEWEFACRDGGKDQVYCGGNDIDTRGWHQGNSHDASHDVSTLEPNHLGLYDMTGNVWEWTCSEYDPAYEGSETRCAEGEVGLERAVRGGSWSCTPERLRASNRSKNFPVFWFPSVGFRLAKSG